jgi:4-methylaminobutanoate oxidase (formaldehyde-forming)
MSLDGVLGAAYLTDGVIDPTGLTNALAAGAKSRGAQFFLDTDVEAIKLKDGRVNEVVTNRGTIKTEIVVNATGQWGGEVGRMVGLTLPVVPMAHLYIITKPIQGIGHDFPTLRPRSAGLLAREVGGLVTGGYERNPAPFGMDGIPKDFKYQLLAPDWDRFAPLMENSIKRVPVVETAEIIQLLNGPEGFTPDGEFLLGPTSVKGFWVACAFCAHGLAGAGGIGKAMAEWIIEGTPEWDAWRLDVRRFGSHYKSQDYIVTRTIETYSQYYDIHFPARSACPPRPAPVAHLLPPDLGAFFVRRLAGSAPTISNLTKSWPATGTNPRVGRTTIGRARLAWST